MKIIWLALPLTLAALSSASSAEPLGSQALWDQQVLKVSELAETPKLADPTSDPANAGMGAPVGVPVDPQGDGVLALHADSDTGLQLMRQMYAILDLYGQDCTEDACRALWGVEESYFSSFAFTYKSSLPAKYTADSQIGDFANQLATTICGVTATAQGDYVEALYRLYFTENESLNYLKNLQLAAGRKDADVAYCHQPQAKKPAQPKKSK